MSESEEQVLARPAVFNPVNISLSPAIDGEEGLEVRIDYAPYIADPELRSLPPGTLIDMRQLQKHTKDGVRVTIEKEGAVNIYLLITQEAALKYAGELVKSVVSASPGRVQEAADMVMEAAKAGLEESRYGPPPVVGPQSGCVSVREEEEDSECQKK